jgi:hypothetical protein
VEKKQFIPSAEQIAEGIEIANKLGHSEIIVNDKGEYFTSKNLAMLSVGQDETKIAKIDLAARAASLAAVVTAALSNTQEGSEGAEDTGDQPDGGQPTGEQAGDGGQPADEGEQPEGEKPAETTAPADGAPVKKGSRKTGTSK